MFSPSHLREVLQRVPCQGCCTTGRGQQLQIHAVTPQVGNRHVSKDLHRTLRPASGLVAGGLVVSWSYIRRSFSLRNARRISLDNASCKALACQTAFESAFDGFSRLPPKGMDCRGGGTIWLILPFAKSEGRSSVATCTTTDAAPCLLQDGRGTWILLWKPCTRSFSAAIADRIYCQQGSCDVFGILILTWFSSLGYAKRDRGTTYAKNTAQP